ncbi:MBL fold metallo-hydrolase [Kineosporia sp. J2-2]|uniref:MBL fold metallo-hydrolase n=1 Tax=Kineosporia corallincola TaxID=2835133 RepID=A0ABS5TG16_9ACTN|nr:MBL fold metallo-hydrolase [Kineosporia corallincola]MBT0770029.1 MBL fold metallo-hydrolase [Kineosporia corallincola]
MKLTKYAHACVLLEDAAGSVLIDPGVFTPNAAELVRGSTAVLITHEHFDHADEAVLTAALDERDDLHVWGPASVTATWQERHPDQVHTVGHGDRFTAGGLSVSAHGPDHAVIHADVPKIANLGYLVQDNVFHPGDSYRVPEAEVRTLLLPTSGPWTKVGEGVDFVRAVKPAALVQIHEAMLSEIGQRSMANFFSPAMLSEVPLTVLAAGESLEV